MCVCIWGVCAPGCHQARSGPRSQPECPSHTWHWIYHVTRRRISPQSERGLPLSAEVMEALDWCNAEDGASLWQRKGWQQCVCVCVMCESVDAFMSVCIMCVWLAPSCTTHIQADSLSFHSSDCPVWLTGQNPNPPSQWSRQSPSEHLSMIYVYQ